MNLKIERVKRNLTQTDLKRLSDISINTIVRVEKGNIDGISVRTLKKIANALGMEVQELFFED